MRPGKLCGYESELFEFLRSVKVVDDLVVRSESGSHYCVDGGYSRKHMHDLPSKHETNVRFEMSDWL